MDWLSCETWDRIAVVSTLLAAAAASGTAGSIFYFIASKRESGRQRCLHLKLNVILYFMPFAAVLLMAFCFRFGIPDLESGSRYLFYPSGLADYCFFFPWRNAAMVWFAGTIVMLAVREIRHIFFVLSIQGTKPKKSVCDLAEDMRRRLGVRQKVSCLESYRVSVPFTIGWLFPKIILPADHSGEQEQELIFLHEMMHIKDHDVLWVTLMWLAECVNWWNPFAYYNSRCLKEYIEYYCDEEVCSRLEHTLPYRKLLAAYSMQQHFLHMEKGFEFGDGKKMLLKRLALIKEIEKKETVKQKKWKNVILAAVLILCSNVGAYAAMYGTMLHGLYGLTEMYEKTAVDETNLYTEELKEYVIEYGVETENIQADD